MNTNYKILLNDIEIEIKVKNIEKINLENILPLIEKIESDFINDIKNISIKNSIKGTKKKSNE
jgi:hypothetical protein